MWNWAKTSDCTTKRPREQEGPGAAVEQSKESKMKTGRTVPGESVHTGQPTREGTGAAEKQEGERGRKETGWAVPEGKAEEQYEESGAAALHKRRR